MVQDIEHEIIEKLIYDKNGKPRINCCRIKKSWLDNHIPGAYDYLISRFDDTKNIPEVLYRIYHHIDDAPICSVCNNSQCRFIDFNNGYMDTCSKTCSLKKEIQPINIELNDQIVLDHFYNQDGSLISTYISERHCKLYGYYNFLYSRYDDISKEDSIGEILYRIKNHIDKKPTCLICGKPVNFKRHAIGYRTYCSIECSRKSDTYYKNRESTRTSHRKEKWKSLGYDIDIINEENFIVHDQCNLHNPFTIKASTFYNRWDTDIVMCPICNPERNTETSIEQVIKNILDNNNISYKQHDRTIISPKELDFFLPDYNIGIECNGIYWHSGDYGKQLAKTKYTLANNKIQLLTFWEDDIHNKKAIIESIIKTKCGLNDRIYARKCIIKEIDSATSRQFIDEYHLQGNVNASIKIGLFYNDELVQVMTFGSLRKSLGSNAEKDTYELYRLCSKHGVTIIGGAGKMLNYFVKKYSPSSIISYCHNEISNGNVYRQLGFTLDSECGQGYTYYNYKISNHRINRYSLRKSEIDDGSNRTADEILKSQGYLKCYDAGVKKYKKSIKN